MMKKTDLKKQIRQYKIRNEEAQAGVDKVKHLSTYNEEENRIKRQARARLAAVTRFFSSIADKAEAAGIDFKAVWDQVAKEDQAKFAAAQAATDAGLVEAVKNGMSFGAARKKFPAAGIAALEALTALGLI